MPEITPEQERTANTDNATRHQPMDAAGHTVRPEDPLYDFEVEEDPNHRKAHAGGGEFRGNAAVAVHNEPEAVKHGEHSRGSHTPKPNEVPETGRGK